MRARQRSQAVVEFGIIALLFTALMFATVDFGLLLNTWLAVSTGTREIARNASVGKNQDTLQKQALLLNFPSVGTRGFAKKCCDDTSAIEVRVEYLTSAFVLRSNKSDIISTFPFQNVDNRGGCSSGTCYPQSD